MEHESVDPALRAVQGAAHVTVVVPRVVYRPRSRRQVAPVVALDLHTVGPVA
jgi:hypothetical protein